MKVSYLLMLLAASGCGRHGQSLKDDRTSLLDGTWVSNCLQIDTSLWRKGTTVASGNVTTGEVTYYTAPGCLSAVTSFRETYTYTIGAPVAGLSKTYNIDETTTKVEIAFFGTDVSIENKNAAFGKTTWAAGVYQDVTGLAWTEASLPQDFSGHVYYSIVKVDGDTAQSGDSSSVNDGSTPDKRPTTLSTTITYTKQ